MIHVGPYRFSETDARRTLHHGPYLLDLMAQGHDGRVLEPWRDQVAQALTDLDPDTAEPDRLARVLPTVWEALQAAGPALRAAGLFPASATGEVRHVHRSAGGVPKAPADHLEVDYRGAQGDVQANRRHHGSPYQALCLWSEEVIESLNAAGHRVRPGAAGENVTLAGLTWDDVRPGVRLRLGTVLCEVSAYAIPCAKNARWFADRDFSVIHHDRGPVSRMYATVLEPGRIAPGDAAVLEP